MKRSIGEIICLLRKEMGYTQTQLGEQVGLSRVIVTKIETGQRAVSLEEIQSFSKVFQMNLNDFLEYTNQEEKEEPMPFLKACKAKKLEQEDLEEIVKIEQLVDALNFQRIIWKEEI